MPGSLFCDTFLEAGYRGVLGNGLHDMELADHFVVRVTDDEGRLDLAFGVLEVHILIEMRLVECLVENDIAVIVLNDQGEFLAGGVLELNLEDNVVVGRADILNRYLIIGESGFSGMLVAAICVAGQGVANDYYQ